MQWLKITLMSALMFGLAGCITLSDVATGAGATAGAVVSSVAGLDPVSTAVVTVVGATAGAAAIEETVTEIAVEQVQAVTNPWQAFLLAFNQLLNHAFEIVIAIGIAAVGIPMVVTFAIGKVLPNRKTKEIEQENRVLKKMMEK